MGRQVITRATHPEMMGKINTNTDHSIGFGQKDTYQNFTAIMFGRTLYYIRTTHPRTGTEINISVLKPWELHSPAIDITTHHRYIPGTDGSIRERERDLYQTLNKHSRK